MYCVSASTRTFRPVEGNYHSFWRSSTRYKGSLWTIIYSEKRNITGSWGKHVYVKPCNLREMSEMSLKHLQNAFVGVRKLIFLLNTLPLQRLHNFSLGSVLHVCIFVFAPMFRCFYCLVLFVFLWTLVWSIFGTFRSSAERYVTTRISVASFYREILFSMLQ